MGCGTTDAHCRCTAKLFSPARSQVGIVKRYETDVRDGVLYLEAPTDRTADGDEWLEIGELDDVVDLIGGEEYVLEYTDRQSAVGWLDTDENGRLTFDVRETIQTTDFDDEFVDVVAGTPAEESTDGGHPKRVATFADLLTSIWDAKGDL